MLKYAFGGLKGPNKYKSLYSSLFSFSSAAVPKENVDCVVIGAGVVGLAVARELSLKGRDVLVVESASTFGTSTSSRNSQVIHAGIYYPPKSLKSTLCVRGRKLLYRYCLDHHIPHKQTGKLIVATSPTDVPKLNHIKNNAVLNGVTDLRMLEGYEAMRMEPQLECVQALFSPHSGIIDSHSYMLSLIGEAEGKKTTFAYNTSVVGAYYEDNQIHLHVCETQHLHNWDKVSPLQPQLILVPKAVVNSAGLSATALSKRFNCPTPTSYFARGCYFTLSNTRDPPFTHLIYPIPEEGGLGVHVTLDLNGQVKFGPDVDWLDDIDDISRLLNKFDYDVRGSRVEQFYPEIRKYYPNLKEGSLEEGYTGIRPKLSGPGQAPVDFLIQGEEVHKVPGLVNLFGIESPGLTASMAIAEYLSTNFFLSIPSAIINIEASDSSFALVDAEDVASCLHSFADASSHPVLSPIMQRY